MPPEQLAQYVAGKLILVLNWWVESKSTLLPREVDDVFLSDGPPRPYGDYGVHLDLRKFDS